MVSEVDGMAVDFQKQELSYYGEDPIPLSALGISNDIYTLDLNYTVQ